MDSQHECWDAILERGADGEIYAGVTHFIPFGTSSHTFATKVVRLDTGSWFELPIDGQCFLAALAQWDGSIVAGFDGGPGQLACSTCSEAVYEDMERR